MRELLIYAGPNPQNLELSTQGRWHRIAGQNFQGQVRVYLEKPQDEYISDNLPRKKFSIQTSGVYTSSPSSRQPLTYDDVMFGIEFDRCVDWSRLPAPTWLVKLVYRWLCQLNDDLEVRNIFHVSDPRKQPISPSSSEGWRQLFSPHPALCKPEICTHIVSAASSMNIIPTAGTEAKQDRTSKIICSPRRIWSHGITHQHPHELVEFNAQIFARNQHPAVPARDHSSRERRLHLRKPTVNIPQTPEQLRKSFHFDSTAQYAFEFYADYFDMLKFELRPRISRGNNMQSTEETFKHAHGAIKSFFSSRWKYDVTRELMDPRTGCSSFNVVCKKRNSSEYFWCIKFVMTGGEGHGGQPAVLTTGR